MLRQIDAAWREQEESEGALRIVTTGAELAEALDAGAVAGILALEGVEALGREPALIATLHRLGVRMVGLTWNQLERLRRRAGRGPGRRASRRWASSCWARWSGWGSRSTCRT